MRFPRRFTRSVSTVALVCSSAGLTSCGGATPPTASAPAAPSSTTTPTESSATDHLDEDGFELRIRAAEVRVGSDSSAEIELLSKQPFKCNDKYPYKFTTTASEGLVLAAPVVTRDRASISQERVVLSIPFKASQPGAHRLSGQFAFSICTSDQCRIEKRELSLMIEAK